MERPAVAERDDIVVSSDAVALEAMFEDLTKRKEDDQVLYLDFQSDVDIFQR